MQKNPLDYRPPHYDRRRPSSFGWLDGAATAGVAIAFAWYVMLASSGYSTRDFAPPALVLSLVVCTYGSLRLKSVPLLVRVLGFPVALVVGYLGFGLLMIMAAA